MLRWRRYCRVPVGRRKARWPAGGSRRPSPPVRTALSSPSWPNKCNPPPQRQFRQVALLFDPPARLCNQGHALCHLDVHETHASDVLHEYIFPRIGGTNLLLRMTDPKVLRSYASSLHGFERPTCVRGRSGGLTRIATWSPIPTRHPLADAMSVCIRFMAGLPMNPATKVVAGRR